MSVTSERLRRMTEYSYHQERAAEERAIATRTDNDVRRRLHDELAALHESLARELADAWHPDMIADTHQDEQRELHAQRRYRLILASI